MSEPAGTVVSLQAWTGPIRVHPHRKGSVGARLEHVSAETARIYASDWDGFVVFCAATGDRALPAPAATVAAFLADPDVGQTARRRRLAAIDRRHRLAALPCPGDDPAVRAALKAARDLGSGKRRDEPPSRAALEGMALRCRGDLVGQRDRAVLLLLAGGLSRATLVGLQAEALRQTEVGLALGTGTCLPRHPRHELCPARAVETWLRASDTRYGPVFRKITRWGTVEPHALRTDAIRRILLRRAA